MEKKSILLVEDDDVVRAMIREGIERQYHVLEAATCSKAIEQSKKPFDLALIDYNLPDSDGLHKEAIELCLPLGEVIRDSRRERG